MALPLELLVNTAATSAKAWKAMLSVSIFGKYSITEHGVSKAVKTFTVVKLKNGEKRWYFAGKLHRNNDLPAVVCDSSERRYKKWFQRGRLHRGNDLPAVICFIRGSSRVSEWWNKGIRHRDNDLPALMSEGIISSKEWFKRGRRHRDNDLPAVVTFFSNGKIVNKEWYLHGFRYRRDDKPTRVVSGNLPIKTEPPSSKSISVNE